MFSPGRRRGRAVLCATVALLSLAPEAPVFAAEPPAAAARGFDIAPQPLASALDAFAKTSGWQVGYESALTAGLNSPGVSGSYDPAQALTRLLSGTGLMWRAIGANTVTLEKVTADGAMTLDPVTVEGAAPQMAGETAWGPVQGYVAKRSAAGTKSDTPIIETPQSVSVVTREQMETTKATSLADALAYTPGVISQPGSFSRMADDFMMRGFNVADGNSGMLRDGMKLQANVYAGSQEPYGLERVDVVRGAASVLYGQLSPGGVINAISKRPTLTPLHEINVEAGSFERKQLSGDFGGSLTEDGTLSYRLTALKRDSDTPIDHFNDDKVYIAPALAWRPGDDTTVTVLASHQEVNTRFSATLPAVGTLYPLASGARLSRDLFVGDPDFDRYETKVTTLGYDVEHQFTPALKLRHAVRHVESSGDWDYLQVTSISGDTINRRASIRDENSQGWNTDTSLEAKLGNAWMQHTVVAGVDYGWQEYDTYRYRSTASSLSLSAPSYGNLTLGALGNDTGFLTTGDQIGYYAQDQIKIADRWVLLVGGRHDRAESETTVHRTKQTVESDDSANTGRVGLVYLADNGLAPYASYSQSFQPVSTASGSISADGEPFKPTEGEQVEVGLRYQPPGTNTMLSGAIYRLIQQNALTPDPDDSTASVQTGEVRSDGVELEIKSEVLEGLNLIASYSYTDARTTKSNTASEVGKRVANTPYNAVALWADYDLGGFGVPGLTIGGGAKYTGSTRATSLDQDVPGYALFDAMLRYDLGSENATLNGWELALNAKNLLDKEYVYCVTSTGCRYGDPLTVIGTLSYRW